MNICPRCDASGPHIQPDLENGGIYCITCGWHQYGSKHTLPKPTYTEQGRRRRSRTPNGRPTFSMFAY